jgi:hypothetical protein
LHRVQLSKITGRFYSLILVYEPLHELPKDMTPTQRCKKVRFASFYAVKAYSGSMIIQSKSWLIKNDTHS